MARLGLATGVLAGFTAAVLFSVTHFAGSHNDKNLIWSPFVNNIAARMDTAEPPDGGMNAHNTIGCAWNDTDQVGTRGDGDVTDTASTTVCLVADFAAGGNDAYPKLVIVRVYASKPTLDVTLTTDAGSTWNVPLTDLADGNSRIYQLCVEDPDAVASHATHWQDLTYWPEVDSTGGYGKIVNYTLTLETTTGRSTRDVHAFIEAAFNGFYGSTFRPAIQTLSPGEVPCP